MLWGSGCCRDRDFVGIGMLWGSGILWGSGFCGDRDALNTCVLTSSSSSHIASTDDHEAAREPFPASEHVRRFSHASSNH